MAAQNAGSDSCVSLFLVVIHVIILCVQINMNKKHRCKRFRSQNKPQNIERN